MAISKHFVSKHRSVFTIHESINLSHSFPTSTNQSDQFYLHKLKSFFSSLSTHQLLTISRLYCTCLSNLSIKLLVFQLQLCNEKPIDSISLLLPQDDDYCSSHLTFQILLLKIADGNNLCHCSQPSLMICCSGSNVLFTYCNNLNCFVAEIYWPCFLYVGQIPVFASLFYSCLHYYLLFREVFLYWFLLFQVR